MQTKSNEIKSTRWRAGVVGLMALLAAGLVAVPASAHHPLTNPTGSIPPAPNPATGCGQVIDSSSPGYNTATKTFTLTHHVGPCVGDGLIVAGSGTLNTATPPACVDYFTVDLDGWDVFGTIASDDGVGIRVTGTCAKVTNSNYAGAVTGGGGAPTSEIYEFDGGIVVTGGKHNVIEKVSVHSSGDGFSPAVYGDGIAIENSSNNTVTNSFVGTNGTDPMLCLAGEVVVGAHAKDCGAIPHIGFDPTNPGGQNTHSKAPSQWGANGAFSGVAIYGDSITAPASGNTIHLNVIRNNYRCFTFGNGSCQSDSVRLEGDTVDNNTVENNEISGSNLDGVAFILGPDGNSIRNNEIKGNGNHHRTHRKGDGVRILGGVGAEGNKIYDNAICGNQGNGIRVDSGNGATTANQIYGNSAGVGTGCADNHVGPQVAAPTGPYYDLHAVGGCSPNEWGVTTLTANTTQSLTSDPFAYNDACTL